MTDNLSKDNRKKAMRSVKSKNTTIEKKICSILQSIEVSGWQQNADFIIGKPDIVFLEKKIVIFVDGCFWHGCPICNRKLPSTNIDYWQKKIEKNKELAKKYNVQLKQEGWKVIRIWEHEFKDLDELKKLLLEEINGFDKNEMQHLIG